jgi:hypothetical protein
MVHASTEVYAGTAAHGLPDLAGDQATSREEPVPAQDGQAANHANEGASGFSIPASGEPQRLAAVVSAVQQLYSVYKVSCP